MMKVASALCGLTGVILGALGAHALKPQLIAQGMTDAWSTAVLYHLIHSVALLAISSSHGINQSNSKVVRFAGVSWCLGILFFSGSLYVLALGGPKALGPLTPLGGLAFISGWGSFIFAGRATSKNGDPF